MSNVISSVMRELEKLQHDIANENASPLPFVFGGNRQRPDLSDRIKTNQQLLFFIYEVREEMHEVAARSIESEIKTSLQLETDERLRMWQIDSKEEVADLLQVLSYHLNQPLKYEAVVSTVSVPFNVSTIFYLYIPVVKAIYYV